MSALPDQWRTAVLESPYAGDVELNTRYARALMAECLRRGIAPFPSHMLYTQPGVLDDTIPGERQRGMAAGFAIGARLELVIVGTDRGLSPGMLEGIDLWKSRGLPVELWTLPGWSRQEIP